MSTKAKICAAIAVAALAVSIRLFFFNGGGAAVFKALPFDPALDYSYDSGASFYSFNSKDFFFCTKDGVKFMSSKGEQHWGEVISLTSPVLYGKCDTVAVGEPRGRAVYVFNTLGKLMEMRFDSPVRGFSVSKTGYLTVILQTASGYRVETYAPGGADPIWRYVLVKPGIYPISADTSPDGRVTAVSVLDLNPDARHSMSAKVMFMYTSESDALKVESADGVFAGETMPDQISRVYFMDNRLLVVSDKKIAAFSVKAMPGGADTVRADWELPLRNEITRFCLYGEAGFGFVAGAPLMGAADPQEAGTLNIFNMSGRRTGTYAYGGVADYLSMNWGGAIVGGGRGFTAVNSRGGVLWQYRSQADLSQFILLDNESTALAAGPSSAAIIRRGPQGAQ